MLEFLGNKKLDLLQREPHLVERGVLRAVQAFHEEHERLPQRQDRCGTEMQVAEDAVAKKWHRVLEHREGLPADLEQQCDMLIY